jgi:hypothetical protein
MKLAFCIRGHIRNGFKNCALHNYIRQLSAYADVDIYLHTWAETEAKSSYRTLDRSTATAVEESHLVDYFQDCTIKKIIIQDDSKLKLLGRLEGDIAGVTSRCPIIAWKRMWAGKAALIKAVPKQGYERVVNTRYDMFTHDVCYTPVKNLLKMTLDAKELSLKYPTYYRHLRGVDNYYAGSYDVISKITHDFSTSLDAILERHRMRLCHEEIFYLHAKAEGYIS